ncbi:hypothetical protein [Paracoccus sp. SSK6]|uniref:hypothetical protein n=1 Tax=Paracoccus sp. SSK6 TaxID=3143131 RepID=UPI00321ADBEF
MLTLPKDHLLRTIAQDAKGGRETVSEIVEDVFGLYLDLNPAKRGEEIDCEWYTDENSDLTAYLLYADDPKGDELSVGFRCLASEDLRLLDLRMLFIHALHKINRHPDLSAIIQIESLPGEGEEGRMEDIELRISFSNDA